MNTLVQLELVSYQRSNVVDVCQLLEEREQVQQLPVGGVFEPRFNGHAILELRVRVSGSTLPLTRSATRT